MNLWCERHRTNHRLRPSEVERVFYTLQAMLADAEREEAVSHKPQLVCPIGAVILSADVEGYAEWVDTQRERRLDAERATKPQLPGRRR